MERVAALACSADDDFGLDTALVARLQEFERRRKENENLKKRLGKLELKIHEQLEAKRDFLDSSCEDLKRENANLLTRITNFESILTALESIPENGLSDTTSNTNFSTGLRGKAKYPSKSKESISIEDHRAQHATNDWGSKGNLASTRRSFETPSNSKPRVSTEGRRVNQVKNSWGTKGTSASMQSWGERTPLQPSGINTEENHLVLKGIKIVKTEDGSREEVLCDKPKNLVSHTLEQEKPAKQSSQRDLIPEKGKVRLGEVVYDSVKPISKLLGDIHQKYAKRTPPTELVQLALEDEEIIKACLKFDPKVENADIQNVYSGNFPTYEYTRCTNGKSRYWDKRDRTDMHTYFEQFGTFPLNFGTQRKFYSMSEVREYICNERHMEDHQYAKKSASERRNDSTFLHHCLVRWQKIKRAVLKVQQWYRISRGYNYGMNTKKIHWICGAKIICYPYILYEVHTPDGKRLIKKFKKKRALANMDLLNLANNVLCPPGKKLVFQTNSPCVAVDQQHKQETSSIMDEFSRRNVLYRRFIDHLLTKNCACIAEKDFEDLSRRGVQNLQDFQDQVQMLSLKDKYFDIEDDIALNMPGLEYMSKQKGYVTEPGLFIPALTPNNKIIGAQVKTYKRSDKKYVWWGNSVAKAGMKASYNILVRDVFSTGRVEDPLFCWRNFDNDLDSVETIAMCEGGLKPALAYYFSRGKKFKFQTSVHDSHSARAAGEEEMKAIDCWIGVAGGTFERNRVVLKAYLQQCVNLKTIVIFPDAGAVGLDIKGCNGGVIKGLTKEILKTRNVLVQDLHMSEDNIFVASWPEQQCQNSDEGLDIDDLLKTPRNINKITVESWKTFIAYILGLANETISREQISNCVAAAFAAQAGSQDHRHTVMASGTTVKDRNNEPKIKSQNTISKIKPSNIESRRHSVQADGTNVNSASSSVGNCSMYLYLVEVSKTYAGDSRPFQIQNWHYITSKSSLCIENPCQYDSSQLVVTDEYGYEEEERVRSSNRVIQQKITILAGGASYKLPPFDKKLLAAADSLFTKKSVNASSQKDESEWVYILPDIYDVKTDTEKFVLALDRFSTDRRPAIDALDGTTGKVKINPRVYDSIVYFNSLGQQIGTCSPGGNYKKLSETCYRKGKQVVSYRNHYLRKGYEFSREEQLFLKLHNFPKSNGKFAEVPAKIVQFHLTLKTKHFQTLNLMKKWVKEVSLSHEMVSVRGNWLKSLEASKEKFGFSFRLQNKRLNYEANIHPSFRQSSFCPRDDNGKDYINYERLEKLGDSVLGYCLVTLLSVTFTECQTYIPTITRALARNTVLARINRRFNMYSFLKQRNLPKDVEDVNEKILADQVEAWIGAKYIDTSLKEVRACIAHMFSSCSTEDLVTSLTNLQSESGSLVSIPEEVLTYAVSVVHSWSDNGIFNPINVEKYIQNKYDAFASDILSTSAKRSKSLVAWGNERLKFAAVKFAFEKRYKHVEFTPGRPTYQRKLFPGHLHALAAVFRFTWHLENCSKIAFQAPQMDKLEHASADLLGKFPLLKDRFQNFMNMLNADFMDESEYKIMLRSCFYEFSALLDIADNTSTSCNYFQKFSEDLVLESLLDKCPYLRSECNPDNIERAFNDMANFGYGTDRIVIDLEVDRLPNFLMP